MADILLLLKSGSIPLFPRPNSRGSSCLPCLFISRLFHVFPIGFTKLTLRVPESFEISWKAIARGRHRLFPLYLLHQTPRHRYRAFESAPHVYHVRQQCVHWFHSSVRHRQVVFPAINVRPDTKPLSRRLRFSAGLPPPSADSKFIPDSLA